MTIPELRRMHLLLRYVSTVLAVVTLAFLFRMLEDDCPRWVTAASLLFSAIGLYLVGAANRIEEHIAVWERSVHPHRKSH